MTTTTPRQILCPTDFSECSVAAVSYALDLAERFDAQVHLLNVWELPLMLDPDVMILSGAGEKSLIRTLEADSRERLGELIQQLPARARARVTPHSLWGTPTQATLAKARELGTDLIVMGTHGRGGFSRALLGSVAERVVRLATCPVLIVRGPKLSAPAESSQATGP